MRVFGCLELKTYHGNSYTYIECMGETLCKINLKSYTPLNYAEVLKNSLKGFSVSISDIRCKFLYLKDKSVVFSTMFSTKVTVTENTTLEDFIHDAVPDILTIRGYNFHIKSRDISSAIYNFEGTDYKLNYKYMMRRKSSYSLADFGCVLREPNTGRRCVLPDRPAIKKLSTRHVEALGGMVRLTYMPDNSCMAKVLSTKGIPVDLGVDASERSIRRALIGREISVWDIRCKILDIDDKYVLISPILGGKVKITSSTKPFLFYKMILREITRQDIEIVKVYNVGFQYIHNDTRYSCKYQSITKPVDKYEINEFLSISSKIGGVRHYPNNIDFIGGTYVARKVGEGYRLRLFDKYQICYIGKNELDAQSVALKIKGRSFNIEGLNVEFGDNLHVMKIPALNQNIHLSRHASFNQFKMLVADALFKSQDIKVSNLCIRDGLVSFDFEGNTTRMDFEQLVSCIIYHDNVFGGII